MANRQGRDSEIVELISEEIARTAGALADMLGLPEDAALDLAFDMVMDVLAAEAPHVLCAYRRGLIAEHPEIVAHLN
ncbi:hypothetical protein [Actinomadura formosensis]|uniref:hypothetical protein n=1 Tax=Actinomadura formosensis TaxID=60706 RepID=UPI003D8C916D